MQKPYDLINAMEYLNAYRPRGTLHAMIIGSHINAVAVAEICRQRHIPFTNTLDPDLYAYFSARLNTKLDWPRSLLLFMKAALRPICYMYWLFAFLYLFLRLRSVRYDLVLFDAWRSKCLYISALPPGTSFVIVDGGFSTLHYGLCAAFDRGGAEELVRVALQKQRPVMPLVLRWLAAQRCSNKTPFFTCYQDQISASCRHPVLANEYRYCSATLGEKTVRPGVMILGIPMLKHIDIYIERALDAQTEAGIDRDVKTIEYRFHPTDRHRANIDPSYCFAIEQGVAERGLNFSYPQFSLEIDFLQQREVPAIIVAYPSSSLRWIEEVLQSRVRIITMMER
ncbi:hypothetical protein [Sphingomonas sp. Root710]|uniref:hypothetical protein n=1 Tax=Sphingomonas sp. Root710 TaxID=1736594 RepID=UPI00138F3C22|nr:hypothetical protein [Sphingomonas sp. Root710]